MDELTARPTGLVIALPGDWWELPLEPGTRDAAIAKRSPVWWTPASQAMAAGGSPPTATRSLMVCVWPPPRPQRSARSTAPKMARGSAHSGSLVAANVIVLTRDLGGNSGSQVLGLAGQRASADGREASATSLTLAGPAVRVRADPEMKRKAVVVEYFVPVPGTGGEVAALIFTSPSIAYEVELVLLFDAMAHTFAFTSP